MKLSRDKNRWNEETCDHCREHTIEYAYHAGVSAAGKRFSLCLCKRCFEVFYEMCEKCRGIVRRMRMLPAPVEAVASRLTELEEALGAEVDHRGKLAEALQEERAARATLQAELEREKKLPWWKRMWRK